MAQTKIGSFIEAWVNIMVGFAINWCANMTVLPLFGFEIGLIFTVVSLVRSYVLRRWFNGLKFGNRSTT
jgi:membrane protein implicated in regulation of membrane protease activity